MQGDASRAKPRAGLMGVLSRNKEADAQQATMAAPQSKTGRFANLRAKLGRPSEQSEVKVLHSTTVCFLPLTACRKDIGL